MVMTIDDGKLNIGIKGMDRCQLPSLIPWIYLVLAQ